VIVYYRRNRTIEYYDVIVVDKEEDEVEDEVEDEEVEGEEESKSTVQYVNSKYNNFRNTIISLR